MNGPDDHASRPHKPARGLATNLPTMLLLAAALLLHLRPVTMLRVSSINMAPTLALDDRVLVRAWGSTPSHGDVVVYRSPFDDNHLQLGRVVALGGDRIELGEDGLRLDGSPVTASACDESAPCGLASGPGHGCLDEDCLLASESLGHHTFFTRRAGSLTGLMFPPTIVPEGHFFVLSDNRVDERDSRIYGAIPRDAVVGVLSFVYYASDETGIRWDRISRPVS